MAEEAHPKLQRVRLLFVHDPTELDRARATKIAEDLGALGAVAAVAAISARSPGEPHEPRPLRTVVDEVLPSVLFACGPRSASAAIESAPWLPVLRVAAPADDARAWPAARPGRREVLLWLGKEDAECEVAVGLDVAAVGDGGDAIDNIAEMLLAVPRLL